MQYLQTPYPHMQYLQWEKPDEGKVFVVVSIRTSWIMWLNKLFDYQMTIQRITIAECNGMALTEWSLFQMLWGGKMSGNRNSIYQTNK